MRSTSKVTNNNSLYYINRNFNNLMKVSSQIAMEQQVINLEDDPMSANLGIRLLNTISRSEQYNQSIKTGVGQLRHLGGYVTSCKSVLDKVNTIVTGAANDPSGSAQSRAANAIEVNDLLTFLVSAGNANDGTRFVFGGTHSASNPFSIVNGRYVNYLGNDKPINIVVDNGTTMQINTTGTDAFGNMQTNIPSRDMNPDINLTTDHSTRLEDLNGGNGVPKGKITVYYSSYPEGLEVDLSMCNTLEDVKDTIERATLEASRNLDPDDHSWLDGSNLDWRDLQDRYVKVTVNPEHNGISLQEFDRGEPLPPPNKNEIKRGLDYSGVTPAYQPGGGGLGVAATANEETTVYDKKDFIYRKDGKFHYTPLRVDDFAGNGVAQALGIKGTAKKFDDRPGYRDPVLDGFLHGRDLDPRVSDRTLLADMEGYNDSVYSFTNGAKPEHISISEQGDVNNTFNNWNFTGLSKGNNTGKNGELYTRAVNRGTTAEPDIYIEIYTVPIDKATAGDLVATGRYREKNPGGTIDLQEANNSGLGGTVSINLPPNIREGTANLTINFGENVSGSVHVPAFIEETDADGQPLDQLNIASGWNIRGLDKPPADQHDENHPASTDLDGNVSVNYRYDSVNNRFVVELSRPAYNDQPAKIIASGSISLGDNNVDPGPPPTLGNAVSGRVEFIGAPGFEGVKGSVYLELPANAAFAAAGATTTTWGADSGNATSVTYQLQDPAPPGTITLGGALELQNDLGVSGSFVLKKDTVFKKGQVFDSDVILYNGYTIKAGTPLPEDVRVPKGTNITMGANKIMQGTVLPEGQTLTTADPLAAGTVIPRGSHYTGGGGFPADTMEISVTRVDPYTGQTVTTTQQPTGYDLKATFATVEDLKRAVEEKNLYVKVNVGEDGKSINFSSSLAGAYLTVSEDTDCYEQMGDKHQQLTGLDLNGLIKGVNTNPYGNVYTEVAYYPPDPQHPNDKVRLISEKGEIIEIDPGYYVRVYSDPEQLKIPYEDRDNTTMVAEGFVQSGEWNPAYVNGTNTTTPFLPKPPMDPAAELGVFHNLVLEERNNSGVSGTVDLDYYGGSTDHFRTVQEKQADGTMKDVIVYDFWNNSDITVFPGGLRPEGSRHTTIQEWDVYNTIPGMGCDYTGAFHGVITGDANSAAKVNPGDPIGFDVKLYKDSSHTVMTAKSDPTEALNADGKVVLYAVDRNGNFALDADGNRIVAGAMAVTRNELLDGESNNFKLTTGANRNYGQEREENVFSTLNDIIDALNTNDLDRLHVLIGSLKEDLDRFNLVNTDLGARQNKMDMLSERHADDILKFTSTLTSRVGMDDQALAMAVMKFQSATNAYQAAMQVSAQVMNLSLLQFI